MISLGGQERQDMGLRYAEFVVPIIKALQELNDSLEQVTSKQQQEIEALRSRLDKIEAMLSLKGNTNASNTSEARSEGVLELLLRMSNFLKIFLWTELIATMMLSLCHSLVRSVLYSTLLANSFNIKPSFL